MSRGNKKVRCAWVPLSKLDYVEYHDKEWGRKVKNEKKFFEILVLEGAQAGLSWYTVLKRRDEYRKAFKNFDPKLVAKMTDRELQKILKNSGVIRNKLKIYSVRKNAQVFLSIKKEFGSFGKYLWSFVDGKQIVNRPKTFKDIPVSTKHSKFLSKDLKKRGMSFVGESIIYAYMQAVGLVDDHMRDCYLCRK